MFRVTGRCCPSSRGAQDPSASHLVDKDVSLNTIREVLDQATIQMILRYAHLAPATTRDAVAELNDPVGDTSGHTARK